MLRRVYTDGTKELKTCFYAQGNKPSKRDIFVDKNYLESSFMLFSSDLATVKALAKYCDQIVLFSFFFFHFNRILTCFTAKSAAEDMSGFQSLRLS